MNEIADKPGLPTTEKPKDHPKMENPVVGNMEDTAIPDRVPKLLGADLSTPESRMGLRNEAKAKMFFRERDILIDPKDAILG